MKAIHKLQIDIKPDELADMLAGCSPSEFSAFWMRWGKVTSNEKKDEIAKHWGKYNNGKNAFNDFIKMIEYHELTRG